MRLEEKLATYDELLLTMGDRIRNMMLLAQEAIVEGDKEKALTIVELDDFVNHFEEDINLRAVEMLSLYQPVAKDLRAIIAGIKIATDLERIGDYAKGSAKFVIRQEPLSDFYIECYQSIFKQVLVQFDLTMKVLKDNDVQLAYAVPEEDEKIDQLFSSVLKRMEEHDVNDINKVSFPLKFTGLLRNLERAGDHTKNICESIVYRVKGQHIDFG